jgi:hypothetical protein
MSTPDELAAIARVVDLAKLADDLQKDGHTEEAQKTANLAEAMGKTLPKKS